MLLAVGPLARLLPWLSEEGYRARVICSVGLLLRCCCCCCCCCSKLIGSSELSRSTIILIVTKASEKVRHKRSKDMRQKQRESERRKGKVKCKIMLGWLILGNVSF